MLQIITYEIYGLHDVFNYKLSTQGNFNDVVIFYGKNGSGKTTLLKLLFHMLSPAHDRGHRTAISKIPFRRIIIELSDGTKILASRKEALSFPIEYRINRPNGTNARWDYVPVNHREKLLSDQYLKDIVLAQTISAKYSTRDLRNFYMHRDALEKTSPDSEKEFLIALKKLNINTYLITADRRIISDTLEKANELESAKRQGENPDLIAVARAHYLEAALNFATRRIRSQIINASNVISKNSNEIYSDIVTRLANNDLESTSLANEELTKLIKELRKLRILNRSYAAYGLVSKLDVSTLIGVLRSTTGTNQAAVKMVMEPYITSLQASLNVLAPIYTSIETFIKSLNSFFSFKRISFKAGDGFEITNDWGSTLGMNQLSSGEQQLLLIFCYALTASEKNSVLIIDEPEISLNIEWQRNLIDSLKKLTGAASNQLVFATHSIELLAQHSENVRQLDPVTIQENDPVYESPPSND